MCVASRQSGMVRRAGPSRPGRVLRGTHAEAATCARPPLSAPAPAPAPAALLELTKPKELPEVSPAPDNCPAGDRACKFCASMPGQLGTFPDVEKGCANFFNCGHGGSSVVACTAGTLVGGRVGGGWGSGRQLPGEPAGILAMHEQDYPPCTVPAPASRDPKPCAPWPLRAFCGTI